MRILFLLSILFPVAAAAQDNLVFIDQIGLENEALIDQVGNNNQLGLDTDVALQEGYYNSLIVTQTGADNQVGTIGRGFEQSGNSQTSTIFNQVEINQVSNGNLVGEVLQAATGAIPSGANRLFILQGQGGLGDGNQIITVIQEQLDGMPGQIARIEQTGTENTLVRVEQRSETAAQFAENIIRARFTGSYNGRGQLTGPAFLSRAHDNALIQSIGYDNMGANGNEMDLTVSGDFNRFGIFQGGRRNSTGFVTITGDTNEVGLRQDGLQNDITMSTVAGDENRVGMGQIGTNRAWVELTGFSNRNDILGLQEGTNDLEFYVEGSGNTVSADQNYLSGLGGANSAEFRIMGEENFLDLLQQGQNTAVFLVEGDLNNAAPASFTGAAATDPNLTPGFFSQIGFGNNAMTSITGDENQVAAVQDGDANRFTLIIVGDTNQAAIAQRGNLNEAMLSQSVSGNSAAIIQ
ncbi:hypothetical protein PXK58_19020 [Phaeobacter gallaeciensis]|uniref:hypothetical protein n=1 Tax=Phaeobacter gallaeciensis TaxID=60890 RepID=UPI00238052F1|nr:hypothetical protein [Phaeobacter gallaeciensis]MDE4276368.1 hypothetical protein [Phaeobacter gallaeciensis]MDE4301653.1 hypothetical protein [Phaeobacter gallaeciensis]MDE5186808.1 hypothetical protein [Phaeobacter gallaeciensis]